MRLPVIVVILFIVLRSGIKCCRLNTIKEVERLNKGRAIFDENEKIGDGLYRIRDFKDKYYIKRFFPLCVEFSTMGIFNEIKSSKRCFENSKNKC